MMSRPERILCVDDDRLVRDTLERMLASLGLDVLCVEHGRQCIEEFENAGGAYDFVLVNYDMPEMDGAEVVRRLVQKTTPARIAITSAYPETTVFEAIPREQVAGFLRKPYTIPLLRRFLRPRIESRSRRVLLAGFDRATSHAYSMALRRAARGEPLAVDLFDSAAAALAAASRSLSAVVVLELSGALLPPEVRLFREEEIPLIFVCDHPQGSGTELSRYGEVVERPPEGGDLLERIRRLG